MLSLADGVVVVIVELFARLEADGNETNDSRLLGWMSRLCGRGSALYRLSMVVLLCVFVCVFALLNLDTVSSIHTLSHTI